MFTHGISDCRLAEEEIVKHITTTDSKIPRSAALNLLRSWFLRQPALNRGCTLNSSEASSAESLDIALDTTRWNLLPKNSQLPTHEGLI